MVAEDNCTRSRNWQQHAKNMNEKHDEVTAGNGMDWI